MTNAMQKSQMLREPKSQQLSSRLRALAFEKGPGAKLPTHRELRSLLNTSGSTLNEALESLEAQNVISRRQGSGIFVSSSLHRKSIALICDPVYFFGGNISPFWRMFVHATEQRASLFNEEVSFHFALANRLDELSLSESLMKEIQAQRVHGVLFVGTRPRTVEWLEEQTIPTVVFAGPGTWAVGMDYLTMIRLGVANLASQGCRQIQLWEPRGQFLKPEHLDEAVTATQQTFEQALRDNGMELSAGQIYPSHHALYADLSGPQESNQAQGYRMALDVFGKANSDHPDGLVILDDMLTLGALTAMQKMGIMSGQDVKIATHTNRNSTVLLGHDELTLLEIDPANLVQVMLTTLNTLMSGQMPEQHQFLIQPTLKKGSTS